MSRLVNWEFAQSNPQRAASKKAFEQPRCRFDTHPAFDFAIF